MDKKHLLDKKRKDIVEGLNKSFNKLIDFKKYKNSPLIITKNGEVVEIDPNTITKDISYDYFKR